MPFSLMTRRRKIEYSIRMFVANRFVDKLAYSLCALCIESRRSSVCLNQNLNVQLTSGASCGSKIHCNETNHCQMVNVYSFCYDDNFASIFPFFLPLRVCGFELIDEKDCEQHNQTGIIRVTVNGIV